MIHVCPLAKLEETVLRSGAAKVVSLVNAGTPMRLPPTIGNDDHLFLAMNDIVQDTRGLTPPGRAHMEAFLGFLADWDRRRPIVIHCWAGISRSTAAAYVAVCALNPDRDEEELAWTLRGVSPSATPNGRIVEIGDDLLGRRGRMRRAIAGIGRGADAFEGTPFELALEAPAGTPRRDWS